MGEGERHASDTILGARAWRPFQGDKRTNFGSEAVEAANHDRCAHEPAHALSPVHRQLARMEILVDLAIGNHGALLLGQPL